MFALITCAYWDLSSWDFFLVLGATFMAGFKQLLYLLWACFCFFAWLPICLKVPFVPPSCFPNIFQCHSEQSFYSLTCGASTEAPFLGRSDFIPFFVCFFS